MADEQIRIEKKSGRQNSGQDKGQDSSRDYEQKKQFNCEERKVGTQIPLEKYRGILVDEAHLLSKDKIERLLELSKKQPVIFSSDSEDVISSEEMDKENIKKLENQTDIKVFRLTNRIRTNAELSTFIQNMMHLPPRMNSRGYPHIFVVYANDDVEAENLLSDYIKQGYQWVEIEESELEEVQADLKMQAVRDMDKIVLLLDERYYYDEKGYFIQTPARIYRYHVLLHFAEEHFPEKTELIREMLVFDLYLRENMKTRPDFAPEQEGVRDLFRDFYFREANDHRYLREEDYHGCDWKSMSRMTHIEKIYYNRETGNRLPEACYIVFDYKRRDPLTGDARYMIVTPVVSM